MNKVILAVRAGCTDPDAERRAAGALESACAVRFPEWTVRRAYTSEGAARALQARGFAAETVPEALESLSVAGVRDVCIASMHLFPGTEYGRAARAADAAARWFRWIGISRPLLDSAADVEAAGRTLLRQCAVGPDEWLVLTAHGGGRSDPLCAAAQKILRERVCGRVLIGAMGDAEAAAARLAAMGCRRAKLTPLMLTAGGHAARALGCGRQGWLPALEKVGVRATPVLRGLGEYAETGALFCAHVAAIVELPEKRMGGRFV